MATVTTTSSRISTGKAPVADSDEYTVLSTATTVKASNLVVLTLKTTMGDNNPLSPAELDELRRRRDRRDDRVPSRARAELDRLRAEDASLGQSSDRLDADRPQESVEAGSWETPSSLTHLRDARSANVWQRLLHCIFPWQGREDASIEEEDPEPIVDGVKVLAV